METSPLFTSISQHCAGISHILELQESEMPAWFAVCDWLTVAAAVRSVEFSTAEHNLGYGWCSGADEFDDAREVILKQFVEDYSVFSFVWGALEAALEIIEPPRHVNRAKRGKIRDACYYLDRKSATLPAVEGLADEVTRFSQAANECLGVEAVSFRLAEYAELGSAGIGLYVVYELRNQFAHGGLALPMPDEENRPISQHKSMVQHATRVVLLQLQMLLLAHFPNQDEAVSYYWHPGTKSDEVPLWLALRTCHLNRADSDFQPELAPKA
jgi:hypothetical protein